MSGSTKPHWRDRFDIVRDRLRREPRVLVASDFDGTLSDIVDRPGDATLRADAGEAFAKLAGLHPRVSLAVLSGRELPDVSKRFGSSAGNIIFAGSHGLEIQGPGIAWGHPSLAAAGPDAAGLASRLAGLVQATEGAELERKGSSLTVHYRRVAPAARDAFLAELRRVEIPRTLRPLAGKMVLEFRPDTEWHKGFALRAVLGLLGIPESAMVYLGDDVTDEDAFREFRSTGVTVQVGAPPGNSSALMSARDPADAAAFLHALADNL